MSASQDDDFRRRTEYDPDADHKQVCKGCGFPLHEHDKERVYPDDGPAGTWHWEYLCPYTGMTKDQVVGR